MGSNVKTIWKRGDGDIPAKAKHVIEAARGELLFKTLELPTEIIDTIRYNAEKNSQTINDYISEIVIERLMTAS